MGMIGVWAPEVTADALADTCFELCAELNAEATGETLVELTLELRPEGFEAIEGRLETEGRREWENACNVGASMDCVTNDTASCPSTASRKVHVCRSPQITFNSCIVSRRVNIESSTTKISSGRRVVSSNLTLWSGISSFIGLSHMIDNDGGGGRTTSDNGSFTKNVAPIPSPSLSAHIRLLVCKSTMPFAMNRPNPLPPPFWSSFALNWTPS